MCLSCVALLSFWAFYDSSNALQIDVFFSIAIVPSSFRFTLHFSFTPSFYRFTFLLFLALSFCHIFFPPYVIHEASFIFFWGCFPRIVLAQFAWALNIIRVKWDAPLRPFREAHILQYRMTLPCERVWQTKNWRCEMKRNRRKSSCWEKLMERLSLDYL